MISLSRQIGFCAAHRYFSNELSEDENKRIFGRCYAEHGHGHNYVLEMTVSGKVDPKTGMIINLTEVDDILKKVTDPMDHHHLNFDIPEFKTKVPTTENLALYCFNEIKKRLPKDIALQKVRVYENNNLWAEIHG